MAKHRQTGKTPESHTVRGIGGRVIGEQVNKSGGNVNPKTTKMTVRKRDEPSHGKNDK